jgi:hypothetical protein
VAHLCANPGCTRGPGGEVARIEGRAKTCSAACRQAFNRRKKRNYAEGSAEGIARRDAARLELDAGDKQGIIEEIFREELRPHVREAITEGTVKGIHALVTLMPELVESLRGDLDSIDPVARGRAQTLLAKYTMGFMDPKAEQANRPLTINLAAMPSPDNLGLGEAVPNLDEQPWIECARCHEERPASDFEEGAPRCNSCQAEIRAAVQETYGG